MLWTTDRHQQHKPWFPVIHVLIQQHHWYRFRSLLVIESQRSISAMLIWCQPLPLLSQYQLSPNRAFVDHLLVTEFTEAEREPLASWKHHQTLPSPMNITYTGLIPNIYFHLGWLSLQTSHRNSYQQVIHVGGCQISKQRVYRTAHSRKIVVEASWLLWPWNP